MVKIEDIKKEISELGTKDFNNDFELQLLQLKRVLASSPSIVRSSELQEFLMQGINHSYQPLKELAFYLLANQTKEEGSTEFLTSLPFINQIISSIVDKNAEIARLASNITTSLGITLYSTPEFNSIMHSIAQMDEISKMRVDSVILRIASHTPEALEYFIMKTEWYKDLIQSLKNSLKSEDPLLTLNIIESVEVFYSAIFVNFQHLSAIRNLTISSLLEELNQTILQFLSAYIISSNDISFDNLIVPAVLRILSSSILIYYFPTNILRIPTDYDATILQLLKEIFMTVSDESIIEATIQAVPSFAISNIGNTLLFNSDLFREYLTYLESRNELLFRSFIHSIANAIRRGPKEEDSPTHMFCARVLSNENFQTLESILARPVPEIRDIIYQLLDELTSTKWGRKMLLSYPSIVYFMLNRENEFTPSAMSWRFSIIKSLSLERDLCIHLNGEQFYLSICDYLSDGEFISEKKKPQAVVADEHL